MAIKLAAVKTVTWPVTIHKPVDGGRTIAETFDVQFEVLKQQDVELIVAENKDVLERVVVGWPKGPKDDEGTGHVAFTEDSKAELLGTTYARVGLFNAYREIQDGRAVRKN